MRAFLSFHADRWLIRPDDGAPPAFFGISCEPGSREAAHIPISRRNASVEGSEHARDAAVAGIVVVEQCRYVGGADRAADVVALDLGATLVGEDVELLGGFD